MLDKRHATAITKAITKAKTEAEKVTAAASAMIETPLDLIRHILQRHEESVIEVMRELAADNHRLRDALQSLVAVSRRYLPDYDEHPEIQKADEALTPNA